MASEKEKKREFFGEWCEVTGWHGMADFYMAKHLAWKIAWIVVIMGGCFFGTYQTVNMISDFVSDDPWVTSMSYEIPQDGSLLWPNLTVCALDWPPIADLFNKIDNFGSQSSDDSSDATSTETVTDTTTINSTPAAQDNQTDDTDWCSQCHMTVMQCGVQRTTADNFLSNNSDVCCQSSSNAAGRCFNIRPNAVFNQKTTASHIYFLFDANSQDSGLDDNYYDASSGFEVRLYLGNSDDEDDFSSSFLIRTGARNVISMILEERRTVIKKRLIQFSKLDLRCSKPYRALTTNKYARDLCVLDCKLSWEWDFCGCYDYYNDFDITSQLAKQITRDLKRCPNSIWSNCDANYTDARARYKASVDSGYPLKDSDPDKEAVATKCADQCPEPCAYQRIEAQLSTSAFLPPQKIAALQQNLSSFFLSYLYNCPDLQRENYTEQQLKQITMLELYYEIKQIRVIEKAPHTTLDEFISNVGGCLGVWSGISLLSIIQIVFFIIRASVHHVPKLRAGQKISNGPPPSTMIYGQPGQPIYVS